MKPASLIGENRVKTVRHFAVSIGFGVVGLLIVTFGLLYWSGNAVDRIAHEREQAIVSQAIMQGIERVAHSQESTTVWDEAVRQIARKPIDLDWLDVNVGKWLQQYADIEEIYLIGRDGQPIYAVKGGERELPATYIAVEDVADPLTKLLRGKHAHGANGGNGEPDLLSPGEADLAIVRGQPAIVSAKPVVPSSGFANASAFATVQVAVVYLDEEFFDGLSVQYRLQQAHFTFAPMNRSGWSSQPLRNRQGAILGYVAWRPFSPGGQVIARLAPVIAVVLLLICGALLILASRLARRTHDLEESRLHAQHRATHDELTGLGNRSMFEQRLDEAMARARRHRTLVALLYIDLDRFKQVNDTLGHPAGDALIRQVARRLVAEVRGYDFVARLGGDEFAVLIAEPEGRASIERICSRIVSEIERPFDLSGSQAFIGASIGIAVAPVDGLDSTELTRKADIALYKAKTEGRSRYAFFTPDMDADVRSREETYRELRLALADCDRQLEVHYQPIWSAETGRIVGVEALLRWHHPELGLVTPGDFIKTAEESGLITILGEWVLHRALCDARSWGNLRVAINVSPIQLRNRNFVDVVRGALKANGLSADRLELELTETALMAAPGEVARCLDNVRKLGVYCALDDFGTGYSSLSHIRDIAVDRIKIDRSFVNSVDTPSGAALVEAIVSLARANGLRLTAEGVETEAQLSFLRRVGCHEIQGYLLSRPVTAGEIDRLISASGRDDWQLRAPV